MISTISKPLSTLRGTSMSGTLFVTATPIGNMGDITSRAVSVLESCDIVLAEDSRVSGNMLSRLGIKKTIFSYHKFTEKKYLEQHIEELKSGKNIALISDAGTPAVSDPGKFLVRAALDENIPVVPVPGASAAISAFSCCGSLENSFVFAGFLPSKGAERIRECEKFLSFGLPVVFYEAPTRIKDLLEMIKEKCSRIVVARELTKQFEEIFVYTGGEIKEKGEFTVVAEPLKKEEKVAEIDEDFLNMIAKSGISAKTACEIAAKVYPELKKNDLKKFFMNK